MPSLRPSLLALAALLLGGLVVPGVTAQTIPGAGGGPSVTAPAPFSWNSTVQTGPVAIPVPGSWGWKVIQKANLQYRMVPSLTGDPTAEVIFYPPASGHPTRAERLTIQWPLNPGAIPGSGAMVVAFHSFGRSEKEVFVASDLPQLCSQRGWALVAPYGLVDTHFGNVPSQKALDAVLPFVQQVFHTDFDRTYAVGFSMGGGAALSYALRHQSPGRLRMAGVATHTGTLDLVREYQNGSLPLKLLMVDADHFGGPPVAGSQLFAYDRVSPARFITASLLDWGQVNLRNLRHIPIWSYANLDDPLTDLVQTNSTLAGVLASQGFDVTFVTDHQGPLHQYGTADWSAALAHLSGYSLPPDPLDYEVRADRSVAYFTSRPSLSREEVVASYHVQARASNTVAITEMADLRSVSLDLAGLRMDPTAVLTLVAGTVDGTTDRVVLSGYRKAPSQVLVGGAPLTGWRHDAATGELALTVAPGPPTTFVVHP